MLSLHPSPTLRFAPLALALHLALACLAAHAQTPKPAAAECPPERADKCATEDEPDRPVRNNDPGSPQVAADAPVPAAGGPGGPTPSLRFERGPLKVRSHGFSLAVDHTLSPQWVVGVLGNVAKGRIERSQTEFSTPPGGSTTLLRSDTTVNTRSTSLAASLSYFTRDAIAIDGALSFTRTQLETQRITDEPNEFSGDNVNRSVGLWLSASRIWRFGPRSVVPQLGLEYVDTRTDALDARQRNPAGLGFRIDEKQQRTLATLLSVQLQQPVSVSFGTLTPYGRVSWRQRLWKQADPVTSQNAFGLTRELDPDSTESRSSIGLAAGVIAQFTRGIATFADVSVRRGSNDLRETRLGVGLRFEI